MKKEFPVSHDAEPDLHRGNEKVVSKFVIRQTLGRGIAMLDLPEPRYARKF